MMGVRAVCSVCMRERESCPWVLPKPFTPKTCGLWLVVVGLGLWLRGFPRLWRRYKSIFFAFGEQKFLVGTIVVDGGLWHPRQNVLCRLLKEMTYDVLIDNVSCGTRDIYLNCTSMCDVVQEWGMGEFHLMKWDSTPAWTSSTTVGVPPTKGLLGSVSVGTMPCVRHQRTSSHGA